MEAAARSTGGDAGAPNCMLCLTKSTVQPCGDDDEWAKLLRQKDTVKKWADDGKAKSALRAGWISMANGTPEEYRSLMT